MFRLLIIIGFIWIVYWVFSQIIKNLEDEKEVLMRAWVYELVSLDPDLREARLKLIKKIGNVDNNILGFNDFDKKPQEIYKEVYLRANKAIESERREGDLYPPDYSGTESGREEKSISDVRRRLQDS